MTTRVLLNSYRGPILVPRAIPLENERGAARLSFNFGHKTTSRFFVHFFAVVARLQRETISILVSRFMDDVNRRR